jgi:hypothetical protein
MHGMMAVEYYPKAEADAEIAALSEKLSRLVEASAVAEKWFEKHHGNTPWLEPERMVSKVHNRLKQAIAAAAKE